MWSFNFSADLWHEKYQDFFLLLFFIFVLPQEKGSMLCPQRILQYYTNVKSCRPVEPLSNMQDTNPGPWPQPWGTLPLSPLNFFLKPTLIARLIIGNRWRISLLEFLELFSELFIGYSLQVKIKFLEYFL